MRKVADFARSAGGFRTGAWRYRRIKFAHANIGKTETITTFPYFCAFLLKRYLKGQ